MGDLNQIPKWHRELEIFSRIKPIIILEGNVLDRYVYPVESETGVPAGSIMPSISDYLNTFLADAGYDIVVGYDAIRGFSNIGKAAGSNSAISRFAEITGADLDNLVIDAPFSFRRNETANSAPAIIGRAVAQKEKSVAVILNFASRYIAGPQNLPIEDINAFTMLQQTGLSSTTFRKRLRDESGNTVPDQKDSLNAIYLIVNKLNDLPAWFFLDNPAVKVINITTPGREEREAFIRGGNNFASFFDRQIYESEIDFYRKEENAQLLADIQNKFIGATDQFSFADINSLRLLSRNEKLHIRELSSVVDLFKFGIKDNPWNAIDHRQVADAFKILQKRVKGQDAALSKTVDVIKRAVTGMASLQHSSDSHPKGVLFFAGPTGTGKTELAKSIAELIFGDEKNFIRFDMSEFSQPHSDQRLLGAPPGYVGYEAGGQLTNAVRNNPFSIILFDEIEKAHPSILDKFLQILEDGRMTDGQGKTVYFSEAVIIFTSNLGISQDVQEGGIVTRKQVVNSGDSYEEVQKKVMAGINRYFKEQISRPEILNRIGENIVVFDFIRPEVARLILDSQLKKIIGKIREDKKIGIELAEPVKEKLLDAARNNLENGGRGIGNVVESHFINPLARSLFDLNLQSGQNLTIKDLEKHGSVYELICESS